MENKDLVKCEDTFVVPTLNHYKDFTDIKSDVSSVLEAFYNLKEDDVGSDTMLCVVLFKKNPDSTFTAHIGASSTRTLGHVKFYNGCIDGLEIVRK